MSRGGKLAAPVLAVEETHHAFYDRHVRAFRAVGEERSDEILSGEECVEVSSGASGGQSVVGGIYEVRTDLEGGDAEAPARERGHEAGGDGGLAHTRVGARHYHAWNLYHSIPFCPR